MSRATEIYPIRRQLEREMQNIANDQNNADILSRYYDARVAEGISFARIYKCMSTLKILSRMFGKKFETSNKDDIMALVAKFERMDLFRMDKEGL
jgi:hypothetical protein